MQLLLWAGVRSCQWQPDCAVSNSRMTDPDIYLERLSKTTKVSSQDNRCHGQDSNRAPSKYAMAAR
jgi:hypothetical protein